MNYEMTGKLIEKFPVQQITDTFRKREFVIETSETTGGREFTETIKFQLIQDRCNELDAFKINDTIKVSFNIRGRKWEKNGNVNYFTNLEAWRLQAESAGSSQDQGFGDIPPPDSFPSDLDEDDNSLPF